MRTKHILTTLIFASILAFQLLAQEYPKAILRGDYPDPSIVRDGEDYYMTHSPFVYSPGFLIWHSKDLINWKPVCRAMTEIVGSAMAPDLVKHKDKYYIYFPAAETNWVIWANNIKGPWSQPIDLKVGNIDPGHIVGEDGKRYLFLSDGNMAPLSDDGLSVTGPVKKVYDGWEFPKHWETEGMWLESPKLIKKGEYFYLTVAEGGTAGPATSHMIVSARSKSIFGPWENSPYNPIIHTYSADEYWWSKGHGTLIDDINGNWWVVYHAYENGYHTLGRQTLLEPIQWMNDGWYRSVKRAIPGVAEQTTPNTEMKLSDDFSSSELSWQWTSWDKSDPGKVILKSNSLYLAGKGSSPKDAQLLLTTATHKNYEASVEVEVPVGSTGGLLLFYNEKAFAGISSNGKQFTIFQNAEKVTTKPNRFGNHFFLKITNSHNLCDILVSRDHKTWETLYTGLDVSGMHHNNHGGFFALRIGLMAAGKYPVKFNNFQYKPLEGYLFAYFTNKANNTNGLHLAWSIDGYKWTGIGPEHSFLKNDYGPWGVEKKMRDPFIMKGPDGLYHCLWTINWDADIIGYASSKDLVHWSRQSYIPVMAGYEARNCWAPEMIYDDARQQYIIFWSSTIKVNGEWKTEPGKKYDHRIYFTTTKDFKTFSPAKIFFDPGHNVIDVTLKKVNNQYIMIYKDERELPAPMKNLLVAVSENAVGPYKTISEKPFTRNWVEGPAINQLPDSTFIVYMEAYRDHKYEAKATRDFIHWEDATGKISFPESTKHGSVIKVTRDFIDHLIFTQKDVERKRSEIASAAKFQAGPQNITINANFERAKKISQNLIGIFFEDINYAADGGLYAELVQNRSFEYHPDDTEGRDSTWNSSKSWKLLNFDKANGSFTIDTVSPIHKNNPHYAVVTIEETGKGTGIANQGYDGMFVKAGENYDFSMFIRVPSGKKNRITVRLTANGEILGTSDVEVSSQTWSKVTAILTAGKTASNARLEVIFNKKGKYAVDMVSLFPQKTFKNRKNGLRADLAQTIADLNPKFVRFPGGCVAHGNGLENMYRWKNTVGPIEQRLEQKNIWRYRQSAGLGYFEYFQFCEDLGAIPLPVLPAAVCCQNSANGGQKGIPMCEMHDYVQEVLDLIEYANGDVSTKWGKVRAEAGHPAPFNLKYVGIGNEDLISDTFEERFTMIYKALKEKHPGIVIVGTAGPFCEGTDYVEGWKIADKLQVPFIDEHYYQQPGWFIHNQDFYDNYPRAGAQVYLGEYASWGNTLFNALAEAAYMTGLERNGDIVNMASYAPLLAKEKNTQWATDLIFFNNEEIKPTPNYYVQQFFGQNTGETYIPSQIVIENTLPAIEKRIASSIVKDEKTGDLIIKLVNILPSAVNAKIHLGNYLKAESRAIKTILTGLPEDKNLKPQISEIEVGSEFTYEMPAYSVTVIRIKWRERKMNE